MVLQKHAKMSLEDKTPNQEVLNKLHLKRSLMKTINEQAASVNDKNNSGGKSARQTTEEKTSCSVGRHH